MTIIKHSKAAIHFFCIEVFFYTVILYNVIGRTGYKNKGKQNTCTQDVPHYKSLRKGNGYKPCACSYQEENIKTIISWQSENTYDLTIAPD